MNFQENLKKYREKAGYSSAKDFASLLGIPYTTYMGYENKGSEPKYELLIKISTYLNVSTDTLLGIDKDIDEEWNKAIELLSSSNIDVNLFDKTNELYKLQLKSYSNTIFLRKNDIIELIYLIHEGKCKALSNLMESVLMTIEAHQNQYTFNKFLANLASGTDISTKLIKFYPLPSAFLKKVTKYTQEIKKINT